MDSLRKGLGGLLLLVGLAALFNYYYFPLTDALGAKHIGQTVWNIIDPFIIATLAVSVALHLADSLRVRNRNADGGSQLRQFPRDTLTALVAVNAMFYAHNYLVKVTAGVDVANPWIWHFIVPPTVVFLMVEGISHWRRRPN